MAFQGHQDSPHDLLPPLPRAQRGSVDGSLDKTEQPQEPRRGLHRVRC